jgi:hypothetical protein
MPDAWFRFAWANGSGNGPIVQAPFLAPRAHRVVVGDDLCRPRPGPSAVAGAPARGEPTRRSQQPCLGKRHGAVARDDEVVVHGYVDQAARVHQLPRHGSVVGRWRGISRGVVVRDDDARRAASFNA